MECVEFARRRWFFVLSVLGASWGLSAVVGIDWGLLTGFSFSFSQLGLHLAVWRAGHALDGSVVPEMLPQFLFARPALTLSGRHNL